MKSDKLKSEDLNEDLVKILVDEHLDPGWEYSYWGKKITTDDFGVMNSEFKEYVTELLQADIYQVPVNIKRINFQTKSGIWYACIYMDDHDMDSCGVIVWPEEKVKEIIAEHRKEILGRLDNLL